MATVLSLLCSPFLWAIFTPSNDDQLPAQHSRLKIRTAAGNRECVLHLPASFVPSKPIPLVMMLHGFGGTALNALRETGWSDKADQETFIVVYPEGTRPDMDMPANFRKNPQSWNDGSGRFDAEERNADDVAFIDGLIEEIGKQYPIDPSRIYITGFSNGASMAFRLGAELSHRVAAIAPVSGTCWIDAPKPKQPLSICYITGAADSLNPLQGGFPKLALGGKEQGGRSKPAVQTFIDRWVEALGTRPEPIQDQVANGIRKRVYGDGPSKAEVVYITIEDLGHHWAGGVNQAPNFLVGKPSKKLNATDTIWEFFRSHTSAASE